MQRMIAQIGTPQDNQQFQQQLYVSEELIVLYHFTFWSAYKAFDTSIAIRNIARTKSHL